MRQPHHGLALLLGLFAAPVLTFAIPTVTNGSFEADPFSTSGTLGLGCGNTLTGWATQCSADQVYPWGLVNGNIYNGGPTPYGKQWVIVGDFGEGGSYIEQTDAGFVVGLTYTLNFALASEGTGSGSQVEVSFPSGSSTAAQIFTAPLRGANYWDTWQMFSYNFVATGTSVTFRFEGLADASALDAGIDNVSITGQASATPEPASFVLLGAGLLGLVTLRRAARR